MLPNQLDEKIVEELKTMLDDIAAGRQPTNPELDAVVRDAVVRDAVRAMQRRHQAN